MHILANENVPGPVVAALRASAHDVMWVKESTAERRAWSTVTV
jgi:hypothetical protein